MGGTATGRAELIKGLWPDKAMYGSIMISVTGLIGTLFGLLILMLGDSFQFSANVPRLLREYPPAAMIALSVVSVVLGYLALRKHNAVLAIVGCVTGFLSLGAMGLGSLLSLVALGFVALSIREKEHANPETAELTAAMWPDKSLAASLFILLTGLITFAWGFAIVSGSLQFAEEQPAFALGFGIFSVLVGLFCGYTAWLLYHQNGALFGLIAGIVGIAAAGFYLLGPILAIIALALLLLAWREREFEGADEA